MVIGRELAEWRRQAWLVASIRSMFSNQSINPDNHNPYLAECRARGVLDDEPPPATTPFNLGNIDTLSLAMRGGD